jgi:hypothetical protein
VEVKVKDYNLISENTLLEDTILRIPKQSNITLLSNIKYKDKIDTIINKYTDDYHFRRIPILQY